MTSGGQGDELADLFPAARRLTVLGRPVELRPAALPQLAAAAAVIGAWQRIIAAPRMVPALHAEAGVLAAAMATLTGLPEAELAACPAEHLPGYVVAVNGVVEINAPFLTDRVVAPFLKAVTALAAAPRDGQTSLPASSAGGTAGPS